MAKKGLSIDGVNSLADFIASDEKPTWMRFGITMGQLTGSYKIANFMSGLAGLESFTFQGKNWTIGGMAFDGILRTDHQSTVRTTQYPVQTGVVMTDHAIVEPAELTIDIMMTDAASDILIGDSIKESFLAGAVGNILGSKVGNAVKTAIKVKNTVEKLQGVVDKAQSITKQKTGLSSLISELSGSSIMSSTGSSRSIDAWGALKKMQLERQPITVVTRLQTYENMIIKELSAPDDYMTLNALKCTVHLRQIIFANVAEVKESARAASTKAPTEGGQAPVDVKSNNDTALKAAGSAIGGIFS